MSDLPHMPTRDEIHSLPRWAKVALVGRCFERMPAIIKKDWPDLPDGALFLICSAGEVGVIAAEYANEAFENKQIDQTTTFVEQAEKDGHLAAAHALAVCGYSCALARVFDTQNATNMVIASLESVTHAIAGIGLPPGFAVGIVWFDYLRVRDAARAGNWTHDTPVPPTVFGEMWPNGKPPGWPDEPRSK